MALHLARAHAVEVVGLTLSEEQWRVAQERAEAAGLENKVRFKLLDYREESGQYDRIVPVGMFEHVGHNHYAEFFGKLRALMTDDGVCLLHSIGRMRPRLNLAVAPSSTSSLAARAVAFGNIGTSSEPAFGSPMSRSCASIMPRRSSTGIAASKTTVTRLRSLYDERFCRMWEFYLQLCEIGYRRLNWMVFRPRSLDPSALCL